MKRLYWQDWFNIVFGTWLFVSPWFARHLVARHTPPHLTSMPIAWNFWIVGTLVATLAVASLAASQIWKEACMASLGLWLCVSAWPFGSGVLPAFRWNALIVGSLVLIFAGWALGDAYAVFQPLARFGSGSPRRWPQLRWPDETSGSAQKGSVASRGAKANESNERPKL